MSSICCWADEFGGGMLKGGGVANIVTHPVETASGIYAMAEYVPLMGGLIPVETFRSIAHALSQILGCSYPCPIHPLIQQY